MTAGDSKAERLRQFLREMSPAARAMLLREFERGGISGENFRGFELIVGELRELQRGAEERAPAPARIEGLDRRLFQPLVQFLVDEEGSEKMRGRIARSSLANIWTWVQRDLMPHEIGTHADQLSAAIRQENAEEAQKLALAFQNRFVAEAEKNLKENTSDLKARQKLVSQLGGENVLDDLLDVIAILKIREALAALSQRLPPQIKNLVDTDLQAVRSLFEHPAVQRPSVFPYALALLFSRLAFPPHILRLAVAAAETDSAPRIAETSYAFAVDLVVDEISRQAIRLPACLRARATADVCNSIKKFHDYSRALTTELDVSTDTRWTKRLAQLRTDLASLLRSKIDGLPGQVRRMLRPRKKEEIASGSELDEHEISDIEHGLEILGACRLSAGEIALNEITLRLSSELETSLDNATQALLESVRQASDSDRPFRQSQLDAAVRFAAKVFGKRYAELLSKAADVAIQGDRRTA
jgi:hypothetical protein